MKTGAGNRARVFLSSLLCVVLLSSCTRAPDLVGIDNPDIPAASVAEATQQKIFIATTRQASEAAGVFYGSERAPELGFASVVVSIPPNHLPGQLERAQTLPPNPRTEFAIIEPAVYETDDAFVRSMNDALAKLPPDDRDVLFFVHGYNNTISDSILRLAQFVEDTNYKGIPVLFSWASAAQTTKYVYDMNSAIAARPQVLRAAEVVGRTNGNGADLFAHSMGSLLLMEAIVTAELEGRFNSAGRLKNIVLASPDIDIDVFRSQLSQIDGSHRGFFVLTSSDDKALGFSRTIAGGINRVGDADPDELAALGVTVIDLSNIEDSSSGSHSKFAGSPEVVQLIGTGLNTSGRFGERSTGAVNDLLDGLPILVVGN